ncbi:hypothetical protein [Nonomuraea sp. JJY05]|uniref:hypothetical protein n=1 Tax=Nonomuraea sp. JJY05 TaxID=3350255 RepID=UPI00373E6586
MPGTLSGLGQVQPTRIFALQLSNLREATSLTREDLVDALDVAPELIDDYLEGTRLPTAVDLMLLLHTIDPVITVGEVVVWQVALEFARALSSSTPYEGDPAREFNRILTLLEFDHFGPHDPPPRSRRGMPSREALTAFLQAALPAEWDRSPWLMAYDFARDLLQASPDVGGPEGRGGTTPLHFDLPRPAPVVAPTVIVGRNEVGKSAALGARSMAFAYGMRLNRAEAQRGLAEHSLPGSTPVTIYLSDEAGHEAVESAVAAWLDAQGLEIVYTGKPVIGSFWRPLLARLKNESEEHLDDGVSLIGRAAGLYGLDTRQADVNQKEAEAFAKVMEALADIDSAVIHHGTLLVVKHAGAVVRRELSQLEVEALRRHPVLTSRPDTILSELQRLADETPSLPHAAIDG